MSAGWCPHASRESGVPELGPQEARGAGGRVGDPGVVAAEQLSVPVVGRPLLIGRAARLPVAASASPSAGARSPSRAASRCSWLAWVSVGWRLSAPGAATPSPRGAPRGRTGPCPCLGRPSSRPPARAGALRSSSGAAPLGGPPYPRRAPPCPLPQGKFVTAYCWPRSEADRERSREDSLDLGEPSPPWVPLPRVRLRRAESPVYSPPDVPEAVAPPRLAGAPRSPDDPPPPP